MDMASVIIEFATWLVLMPAGIGLAALFNQRLLVSNRQKTTGTGWSAADTFEVQDAVFGAAAFFFPIAATFSFSTADIELPAWQWWSSIVLLCLVCSVPIQLHSMWSRSRKTKLGIATEDTNQRNSTPAL